MHRSLIILATAVYLLSGGLMQEHSLSCREKLQQSLIRRGIIYMSIVLILLYCPFGILLLLKKFSSQGKHFFPKEKETGMPCFTREADGLSSWWKLLMKKENNGLLN